MFVYRVRGQDITYMCVCIVLYSMQLTVHVHVYVSSFFKKDVAVTNKHVNRVVKPVEAWSTASVS